MPLGIAGIDSRQRLFLGFPSRQQASLLLQHHLDAQALHLLAQVHRAIVAQLAILHFFESGSCKFTRSGCRWLPEVARLTMLWSTHSAPTVGVTRCDRAGPTAALSW